MLGFQSLFRFFTSFCIGQICHSSPRVERLGRCDIYGHEKVLFLCKINTVYSLYINRFTVFMFCIYFVALEHVGGVPYDILQPVLAKCSPNQLYNLEDFNPVRHASYLQPFLHSLAKKGLTILEIFH